MINDLSSLSPSMRPSLRPSGPAGIGADEQPIPENALFMDSEDVEMDGEEVTMD